MQSHFIPNPHLRGTDPIDALRLIRSENVGPMTFFHLVKFCGSVKKAIEMAPGISRRGGRKKPISILSKADAEHEFDAIKNFGAEVVMYGEERYPRLLQFVADAPPLSIVDNSTKSAVMASLYVQDEWQLSGKVTLNYGGRFDYYDAYRQENQLSPRVNLVWQPDALTTLHVGYARYFSPPAFELVANTSIARFVGTSGAANSLVDTTPQAERQHYFDVGVQRKLAPGLTVGIDGYYRLSRHLIDEGQFGAPIILTPFNYAYGRIRGINLYANYQRGPWLVYANFAAAKAQGRQIESSEFSFGATELAYIASHFITLDHDQTYTGSGGISYAFRDGALKGLKLGSSMIYGSGLRSDLTLPDGTDVPNGAHLPAYAQFNLAASYKWAKPGVELRFDVTNAFDSKYEIRDGTGVGVGAPQFGARQGLFFGVRKAI
jgi:outer membrane receptor protein involved in Fe transport